MRDELIRQVMQQLLEQAQFSLLHLLPVQLSNQVTTAGNCFLRWRRVDGTAMGFAQWLALLLAPCIPPQYRLEQRRALLNAQPSGSWHAAPSVN